jgi:uncharacterized membrane protein YccC
MAPRSFLPDDITSLPAFVAASATTSARTFITACRTVRFSDPAARVATSAVLAAVIATMIAYAMHLDDPWWATASGYMATQRTAPASVQRAMHRIAGTVAGAVIAVVAVDWVAYDLVACTLLIFTVCTISIIGNNVSRYAYSWMLVGLTCLMVLLASLGSPAIAPTTAIFRVLEIVIGSVTAALVALVVEPFPALPTPVALGWSGLLGPKLYITLHAIRWSIAIALLPLIWRYFEVTDLTQMAITVVVVLAIPVTADPADTHRQVLTKGLQRLMGCVVGGVAALLMLGLGFDSMLPWLLALAVPLWLCSYIQNGTHSATYIGTQAGFVLIVTMIQGEGPPLTMTPAFSRLVGIFFGLLVVLVVVLVTHPPASNAPAAAPGR